MSYVSSILHSTLAGPPGLPGALCRRTPAPLADLLSFSNRETGNSRLGPAKVPQPSVDLIYMAPSARSLARSVSTAECEVSFLPSSVLVWNGGGGAAIKEAWKEWNPTKNVLNLANVESRYRGGLVKLSDSVELHGASERQAKVFKCAEKNQVERYVIRRIIVAINLCCQRAQSARKEELRTNNPHDVWVGNSSCNVVSFITRANVVGMRRDSGDTVLQN